MRAIRIHAPGGPEALRLEEIVLPNPRPGEVRVRHEAVGVNFIDVYHRNGLYPVPNMPSGLGVEAAGGKLAPTQGLHAGLVEAAAQAVGRLRRRRARTRRNTGFARARQPRRARCKKTRWGREPPV